MRTLGLIGGMSWESSVEYYRIINQETRRRLGGSHSARLVMTSVDFAEVKRLQAEGGWEAAGTLMVGLARDLQAAGAEAIVICTNTMHRLAEQVEAAIELPLIHIADATANAVREAAVQRVGLLGTRYTMEQDFYKGRLADRHGLDVIVPESDDRTLVHDTIYGELVKGIIADDSRRQVLDVIDRLVSVGAEGVIAGCTEIELLVEPRHMSIPYFPTTSIHAEAAVDWALGDE